MDQPVIKQELMERLKNSLEPEYRDYLARIAGKSRRLLEQLPDEVYMGILVYRQLLTGDYPFCDLESISEDERPLSRLTRAFLSCRSADGAPFEELGGLLAEMREISLQLRRDREWGRSVEPARYYDRNRNEIRAGMVIESDMGIRKMVYATEDNDLGVSPHSGERTEPSGPLALQRTLDKLHHYTDGNDTLTEWEIVSQEEARKPPSQEGIPGGTDPGKLTAGYEEALHMSEGILGNLNQIIRYCDEAAGALERFGGMEELKRDAVYQNAAFFCVYQAGGLVKRLPPPIRDAYPQVPWKELAEAHRLGEPDLEMLWNALTWRLPALRSACVEIAGRVEALEQEGMPGGTDAGIRM